jgi:SPOR domain
LPNVPDDQPEKGRLRARRDALLLELGALVYELQRRGERAPELLQRKAGELGEVDERVRAKTPDETGPGTCPACGAEAEPGQLVCTNCGARLALGGPRRGPSVAASAAIAVLVVLGAAASGFALSEITSDDGDDAPAASQAPPPPAAGAGEPQESSRAEGPADGSPPEPAQAEGPADDAPDEPRRLLLDWPDDLTAHTVVLVTTSDQAAARRLARQAARSGIEAGLLRGEDYNLGAGLWVVFAGRFDTPEGASQQASDLAERFPGAYPQLVEPAG